MSATAGTTAQAQATANGVAESYIGYVDSGRRVRALAPPPDMATITRNR